MGIREEVSALPLSAVELCIMIRRGLDVRPRLPNNITCCTPAQALSLSTTSMRAARKTIYIYRYMCACGGTVYTYIYRRLDETQLRAALLSLLLNFFSFFPASFVRRNDFFPLYIIYIA